MRQHRDAVARDAGYRTEARDGTPLHLTSLAVSCVAYLIALVIGWRARAAAPAWAIWSILVFAVAMRLPHLFPATGEGSDIFQVPSGTHASSGRATTRSW